jgi:hypothetical protein
VSDVVSRLLDRRFVPNDAELNHFVNCSMTLSQRFNDVAVRPAWPPLTYLLFHIKFRDMETQLRMYFSGTIAALAAFLFVSLAFSGQFNFVHGGVFLVFFVVTMVVFTNFVKWADSPESN